VLKSTLGGDRMRAVVIIDEHLEVLERPDPVPGPGAVVVTVASAGVNAADLLQRRGLYPAPAGVPADIPGMELAGVVTELGEGVEGIELGARVMAIVGGGAQAERCCVDAAGLLRVPEGVELTEAGGLPETFITAHDALVTRGRLEAGQRALVTGAAGGVGTAGVQIAAALGAEVIASVRDRARRAAVEALGATRAIDPAEVTDYGPYDVVLELVGAASLSSGVLKALAPEARVVVIGVGGGSRIELDLLALMAARASIGGATLRARSLEEKAAATHAMGQDLMARFADGTLTVPLLATYPLDDAAAAYERFSSGSKLGKIVLVT
jgi:NADPH:quinone reductase-like Zn-dependent oxidoreductase